MNTENAANTTPSEKPKKQKAPKKAADAKPAAPAPSAILNIAPTAMPGAVESAYQNHVAKLKATKTASAAIAQRDTSAEIGKLHRAKEEPRKALKKQRTKDLEAAQASYALAKRSAQSLYDSNVHHIETENEKAVNKMSHDFNAACEPINAALTEKLTLIEKETATQLALATAEYTAELAAAQERTRIAAEVKKAAEEEAKAKLAAETPTEAPAAE